MRHIFELIIVLLFIVPNMSSIYPAVDSIFVVGIIIITKRAYTNKKKTWYHRKLVRTYLEVYLMHTPYVLTDLFYNGTVLTT